jgi:hypothetical protein
MAVYKVVTRTFSDGRTDDRMLAVGVPVTWTHCSVLFEVTWGKTRRVRADATMRPRGRTRVRAETSASARTRPCIRADALASARTPMSARTRQCVRADAHTF